MKQILEKRIVPAAIIETVEETLALCDAMLQGKLNVIEITLRTPAAAEAIRKVTDRFPEMYVGAGTVLTADQLDKAIQAGARYAVAPGLNEALVAQAAKAGIDFIPGVATSTEIDRGIAVGCKILKFFPAENLGGVNMLKALAGPFAHTGVRFLPTGGINAANATSYLALPVVAAVGGSWMINPKLIKEKKWSEITKLCAESLALGSH